MMFHPQFYLLDETRVRLTRQSLITEINGQYVKNITLTSSHIASWQFLIVADIKISLIPERDICKSHQEINNRESKSILMFSCE